MILLKDGFKELLHSLYFSERKCNTYCWDVFLKSYIYIEEKQIDHTFTHRNQVNMLVKDFNYFYRRVELGILFAFT